MVAFAVICAVVSVIVGTKTVDDAWVTLQLGPFWYHALNALMGFGFAVSAVKFFTTLGKVIEAAGTLAWFLVIASVSLTLSGAYLLFQFYRVYVW